MDGMTAQHAMEMNPAMAKRAMTVWQDAYPSKPKALHFINMPGFMETIFTMVQSFQKEKMRERSIVHPRVRHIFASQIEYMYCDGKSAKRYGMITLIHRVAQ
jgi:CRAL/TRIO domain